MFSEIKLIKLENLLVKQIFHLNGKGNIECNPTGAYLLTATTLLAYPDELLILSASKIIDKIFLSEHVLFKSSFDIYCINVTIKALYCKRLVNFASRLYVLH